MLCVCVIAISVLDVSVDTVLVCGFGVVVEVICMLDVECGALIVIVG